ncbi:MAG: putative porin [Dysgonamonadaceae bacterium]
MKKTLSYILFFLLFAFGLMKAQVNRSARQDRPLPPDSTHVAGNKPPSAAIDTTPSIKVWTINETTGEISPAIRDSIRYNFQQTTIQDGHAISSGYLGNIGSPSYSRLFFERGDTPDFFYLQNLGSYYYTPGTQLFYNTKIPYSNLFYQSGGSQNTKEERVKGLVTTNLGKKLNLGFNIDYVYARGNYQYLSNKSIAYNLFSSYQDDKYEMHAWAGNYNYLFSENGGMSNDLFITNPNSQALPSTNYTPSDFPVNMKLTWNRVKGRQIYFTNRYNLGYYTREKKNINKKDTTVNTFVPVASFIYTSQFSNQSRVFNSHDTAFVNTAQTIRALDTLYTSNNYSRIPYDKTSLSLWKNTFGISMREGFRPWVKFGLTAYISNINKRYNLPDSVLNKYNKHNENSTSVGGVLTKNSGRFVQYDLNAELSILGPDLGRFVAEGKISTFVNIGDKKASLTANGYIKNLKPNYLESHVYSKYFKWSQNFGDIRRVYAGGILDIPQTGTKITAGVENIQNYIYFNSSKLAAQYDGNVQIVSARLDQQLRAGVLHWDNQLAYQTTTNANVIPVPAFSAYSNLYLLTKVSKVLTIQMGIDAHYHSAYYAPGYEPALMTFYNQQDVKVGGFPMSTVYINAHLKKTRFFVMYYNILKSVGKNGYFSIPHYPVNPTIFKWGLSWDFDN